MPAKQEIPACAGMTEWGSQAIGFRVEQASRYRPRIERSPAPC